MTNTTATKPLEAQEVLRETLATQYTKVTNEFGVSVVKTTLKQAYKYPTANGKMIIGFPVNLKREAKQFKEL